MDNDYNLKCPCCGQSHEFHITAHHTITIKGDDIDHDDSLTWNLDDVITCGKCGHSARVDEFEVTT